MSKIRPVQHNNDRDTESQNDSILHINYGKKTKIYLMFHIQWILGVEQIGLKLTQNYKFMDFLI